MKQITVNMKNILKQTEKYAQWKNMYGELNGCLESRGVYSLSEIRLPSNCITFVQFFNLLNQYNDIFKGAMMHLNNEYVLAYCLYEDALDIKNNVERAYKHIHFHNIKATAPKHISLPSISEWDDYVRAMIKEEEKKEEKKEDYSVY
jgi:hypothetical protein